MSNPAVINNPVIWELLRNGNAEGALKQKIQKQVSADPLRVLLGGPNPAIQEDGVYCTLTLGDLLYDYVRIEPEVVKAIDFARKEDLDNIFKFSYFAERHQELVGSAYDGSVNQLQGYVAERLVAHHLEAQGHDVVFANVSNQEGWDLLVDGQPFQVKCLASAQGVHEHLSRFDYPVIVNGDLADQVGHLHNVHVDPLLMHDDVRAITEQSLHYGRELTDFEIPWISLAASSVGAIRDLYRRDTDIIGASAYIASNTGGRVVCASMGKAAAANIGFLCFGPAGAVICPLFGTIAGAMAGREAGRFLRSLFVTSNEEKLRACVRDVAAQAAEAMPVKLSAWDNKAELIDDSFIGANGAKEKVRTYIMKRFDGEVAYYINKKHELEQVALGKKESRNALELWQQILVQVKRAGVHAHMIKDGLANMAAFAKELISEQKRWRV